MATLVPTAATAQDTPAATAKPRLYAWIVLALIVGLMLSDYLSRQVVNAVFPFLKAEWLLSDAQLGSLVSVVGLTVGVLSFPISLLSDRYGRVKSATVMAIVWGLATIACGYSGNFMMLLIARACVGLGEAGYGSAGAAILVNTFPRRMHAAIGGIYLAAAVFGSVLGLVLGGAIAQRMGWPVAFILIGAGGLVLALVFPMVVKEPVSRGADNGPRLPLKAIGRELFATRTATLTYIGSGLSNFTIGTLVAWVPSYLNRYQGMEPAKAALNSGVLILAYGLGMIVIGIAIDRLSAKDERNRLRIPALSVLAASLILLLAFFMPPGAAQFALFALAMLLNAGFAGATMAVIGDVTVASIHATAFATVALANNLLGLAPGPFVTGALADVVGLDVAMRFVPLVGLLGAGAFWIAAQNYPRDRRRHEPARSAATPQGDLDVKAAQR